MKGGDKLRWFLRGGKEVHSGDDGLHGKFNTLSREGFYQAKGNKSMPGMGEMQGSGMLVGYIWEGPRLGKFKNAGAADTRVDDLD